MRARLVGALGQGGLAQAGAKTCFAEQRGALDGIRTHWRGVSASLAQPSTPTGESGAATSSGPVARRPSGSTPARSQLQSPSRCSASPRASSHHNGRTPRVAGVLTCSPTRHAWSSRSTGSRSRHAPSDEGSDHTRLAQGRKRHLRSAHTSRRCRRARRTRQQRRGLGRGQSGGRAKATAGQDRTGLWTSQPKDGNSRSDAEEPTVRELATDWLAAGHSTRPSRRRPPTRTSRYSSGTCCRSSASSVHRRSPPTRSRPTASGSTRRTLRSAKPQRTPDRCATREPGGRCTRSATTRST